MIKLLLAGLLLSSCSLAQFDTPEQAQTRWIDAQAPAASAASECNAIANFAGNVALQQEMGMPFDRAGQLIPSSINTSLSLAIRHQIYSHPGIKPVIAQHIWRESCMPRGG
jgi:hypothetical protein